MADRRPGWRRRSWSDAARPELLYGHEWLQRWLQRRGEVVLQPIVGQLVGDGGDHHALVEREVAVGDLTGRHIHRVLEPAPAIQSREVRRQIGEVLHCR